jgi:uncharacterized membrane protein
MQPALTVAALWLLFAGTHVGLATRSVRDPLATRLGEHGFLALYSTVAAATFTLLVVFYADHRFEGAPGLALGRDTILRVVLMAVVGAGVVLTVLLDYPRSPTALFGPPIRAPYGVERITRHPFFAGVALLAAAHTLLATRLVGTVFFLGLGTLAIVGSWHQDRKLLARRGRPYAEYLAATSAVPFAAVASGRQRLVAREISAWTVVTGVGVAVALRLAHDGILARHGLWLLAAVFAGAALSTLQSWRRARRQGTLASATR